MAARNKGIQLMINKIEKAPDIPSMVVSQIIELISSGVLKPGDRLPSELEMTRRFGISRISLREAMKLLEAKGYIESQGRKGKYVKSVVDDAIKTPIEGLIQIDHKKIWELLEVRRIIDAEAAALAALRANEEQRRKLNSFRTQIELMGVENLIQKREGGKFYAQFYNHLYEATNNTIFAHILNAISTILRGVLPYSREKLAKVKNTSKDIYEHHIKILDAINSHKPDMAREAVVEHIDYLERTLKKILK
ncbi:MAG: FadR family transcriptional regulator [Spirochaetes bacterium]|nr:FCD domain-containing protein [Spirochaetota bacterium]NMB63307.1 FadR family transcriptional regulator [Spirochaetota bacterium]HOJ27866.1 FCD domain-containing protein [Spirochaetota bacterium]HOM10372.1 FCD domain-containing protein [Spirochaetota bacterium]HPP50218.1 FCD domain-containing protein [Spirochaetota bacterium]